MSASRRGGTEKKKKALPVRGRREATVEGLASGEKTNCDSEGRMGKRGKPQAGREKGGRGRLNLYWHRKLFCDVPRRED